MPELQSEFEDLLIKLDLVGNKSIIIGIQAFWNFSSPSKCKKVLKYLDGWGFKPSKDGLGTISISNPYCKLPSFYRQIIRTFNDSNIVTDQLGVVVWYLLVIKYRSCAPELGRSRKSQ